MKKFVFISLLLFASICFAQAPLMVPEPTAQDFKTFFAALGGWASIGTLGFVMIGVQTALLIIRTKFVKMDGWLKLLIVNGLTLAGGVLALKLGPANLSWAEALLHSQTLAAFQVFAYSALKHTKEKIKKS